MTNKKWTYHTAYYFKDEEGKKHNLLTQLYQIGVYIIQDGNSGMQGNMTPANIVILEKKLKKAEKNKEISELTFGNSITVSEIDGFFKQV